MTAAFSYLRTSGVHWFFGVVWLTIGASSAAAHDIPREVVVTMQVTVAATNVRVRVTVPAELMSDIKSAALAARDIANRIEFRRGDALLPLLSADARTDAEQEIEADLHYAVTSAISGSDSVRVNGFRHPLLPVRTNAIYQNGRSVHVVSVTGSAGRATFDPSAWDTVKRFAGDAIESLPDTSPLWFL